jgi:hypothetical protein
MTLRSRSAICCPTASRALSSGPSVGQLRGAHGKHVHLCLADDEPEVLEEPADLVLNIPLDLDEQSSADQKGFDRVAVEIFDADLLVPPTLHDACNTHGVVTVSLLLICSFRAAFACLASIQMTGNPSLLSSVHSHVDVAPASSPTRTTCGACDLTNAAMVSGSDATTPSRSIFPVRSTMQIAVSFSDTSSPT